jgi:predicted nucleic acid-binding protein
LAEAKRAGLIERVKTVIEDLQEQAGFWVSADLVQQVLIDLGEA